MLLVRTHIGGMRSDPLYSFGGNDFVCVFAFLFSFTYVNKQHSYIEIIVNATNFKFSMFMTNSFRGWIGTGRLVDQEKGSPFVTIVKVNI